MKCVRYRDGGVATKEGVAELPTTSAGGDFDLAVVWNGVLPLVGEAQT